MKTLVLAILFAGIAFPQCGKLVTNPITHKLDCTGIGATGATGAAGAGFNGSGTFAQMNASSPSTNNVWELTDSTFPGYCGAGSGTAKAVCVWTGAAWVTASGVLSGGLSTQVPFQTGVGLTGFSTAFTYNDSTKFASLFGGLNVGSVGVATGQVVFNGTTSGSVTIKPNAVAGSSITMLLPNGDSNPVRGTADPADSQLVNWIGTDGTIHRIAVPPSNVLGGSGGQIPFQSAANTTAFSTGLAYNDTTKTLGLIGGYTAGQTGTATGQIALNGLTSGTVTIKPNAIAGTATMTVPAVNSNAVVGIANPSDTSVVNYIGTDGVQNRIAQSGGGGGAAQRTTVTANATPVFAVTSAVAAYLVLVPNTNVTSSSLTVSSGAPFISLAVCQGATPRTIVLPTTVKNAPAIDARANYCTIMEGNYDGTNLIVDQAEIRKDDGSAIPGEISILQASGTNYSTITPLAGAANRTVTIPGSADSAVPLAYNCGAGNHAVSFDVATGITACAADSGGSGTPAQRTAVSASATPTFAVTSANAAYMVLTPTVNVTSSSLSVSSGNPFITLAVCQGATPRTVVLPTNVLNAPAAVDARAHYCTIMSGDYDGTNLIVDQAEIRKDDGSTIPGELTIAQASGTNATTLTPLAGSANRTVVIPGSANSAVPLAYSCGGGNHATSFDVATGITTCAADSGGGGAGDVTDFSTFNETQDLSIIWASTDHQGPWHWMSTCTSDFTQAMPGGEADVITLFGANCGYVRCATEASGTCRFSDFLSGGSPKNTAFAARLNTWGTASDIYFGWGDIKFAPWTANFVGLRLNRGTGFWECGVWTAGVGSTSSTGIGNTPGTPQSIRVYNNGTANSVTCSINGTATTKATTIPTPAGWHPIAPQLAAGGSAWIGVGKIGIHIAGLAQ